MVWFDYFLSIFLGLLLIFNLMIYFISIKLTGKTIGTTSFSKERIYFLILGLVLIMEGFINSRNYFSNNDHVSQLVQGYIVNSAILSGILFISVFLTSKIIIGFKGISLPYIPFFISKDQIESYKIENKKIILNRKGKKGIVLKLRDNEISKVKLMLNDIMVKERKY